jgi:hypothetical protein
LDGAITIGDDIPPGFVKLIDKLTLVLFLKTQKAPESAVAGKVIALNALFVM